MVPRDTLQCRHVRNQENCTAGGLCKRYNDSAHKHCKEDCHNPSYMRDCHNEQILYDYNDNDYTQHNDVVPYSGMTTPNPSHCRQNTAL